MTPARVIVECDVSGWTITVFDAQGEILYEDTHMMDGLGTAKGTVPFNDINTVLSQHPKFVEAMDDLSFGPFGVAQALLRIDMGDDEINEEDDNDD